MFDIDIQAHRRTGEHPLDFDGSSYTSQPHDRAASPADRELVPRFTPKDIVRDAHPVIAGTVSSHITRVVLEAALQVGVPEHAISMIDGLRRESLEDDRVRVSSVALLRLWELLCAAGGPGVGVRAAATAQPGRLHVWDFLIAGAGTLAEGFGDAARFSAVMTDPLVSFVVNENGPYLSVGYRGEPDDEVVAAAINEFTLCLLLQRARSARGSAADPIRVDFSHLAPLDRGYLIEAFGTSNIHFGQACNSFTMINVEGAQDRRTHDPELRRIMHLYAQSIIDTARPLPSWKETFHAAISEVLADSQGHGTDIEVIAHRLAVSPRTLQRRLADRDTSWRRELEVVRCQHATRLLRDTPLSLEAIASRVGYSDHRTLRRAFRRWTGQTPDAYRRGLRQRWAS